MLKLINLENKDWDILLSELKDREEEVKEEVLKSVSNILEDVKKMEIKHYSHIQRSLIEFC